MSRLSIIGVDNGRQPIFNEDETVALVMNGEIYNYLELKRSLEGRGHVFKTDSDAEAIVHLYEERGAEAVESLRGMFAFALFDAAKGEFLLARDRAGQKPLYYALGERWLLFGSEIKAIHAAELFAKEIDAESLTSYLAYGFVVGEGTLFKGVNKLAAGCTLTMRSSGAEVTRYWDFPAAGALEVGLDEAAERVRELIEEAVRIRLMSEVPLGAFLSGGIDSSTVVGIMSQQRLGPVETFSVGFEDAGLDELHYARTIAEHFGTRHHEVIVGECTPELLWDMNWHQDEPAGDPASLPTFCLARFARQRITVALTGEGADEVFAGYPHHLLCHNLNSLERSVPGLSTAARCLDRAGGALGWPRNPRIRKALWIAGMARGERTRGWLSAFTDRELNSLLRTNCRLQTAEDSFEPGRKLLRSRSDAGSPLVDSLIVDSKLTLADHLLMKVDKMTMAASLEARSPLLDHRLIEYAASLPVGLKLSRKGSKLVLRRAVRDLLPEEIITRPKQGFDVPIRRWLFRDLKPLVHESVLSPQSAVAQYLDLDQVRALWSQLEQRDNSRLASQFWRILNLAVWHELHWPQCRLSAASSPRAVAGKLW